MNTKHLASVTLLALSLTSMGSAATVVEPTMLPSERYDIRLGGFFVQDIDSQLRVDAKNTATPHGTTIDLGDNLNIDNSVEVFRADFTAYIAKRHRLDFSWFNMKVSGRTTLLDDIDWGNTHFPDGITVESYIKNNIFRLSYTYFIAQHENWQFGLSLGAHVMKINSGITAVSTALTANEGFTAPLPVLGLVYDYAITPTIILRGHGEWFGISYDEYEGSLIDIYGAVEWRFKPWGGLGVGVEYFNLNIERDGKLTLAELDHQWIGYQAYLSFRF